MICVDELSGTAGKCLAHSWIASNLWKDVAGLATSAYGDNAFDMFFLGLDPCQVP
jgi:hypothetical protein